MFNKKNLYTLTLVVVLACIPKISEETLRKCQVYTKIEKIHIDMDVNKDRHIDRKEYMDYLVMRFYQSDTNKDKIHSKEEFMEMFTSNYIKKGEKIQPGCEEVERRVIQKGKFSFRIVDMDSNGEITLQEFIEKHRDAVFKYVDYNRNNALELKEFIVFMI